MIFAHQIKISVFAKPEDDEQKIAEKFRAFIPFTDLGLEKIAITKTTANSFEDRKIQIYEAVLSKEKHTNAFLELLKQKLPNDQKELLIEQLDSRLDAEHNFFIRLDKSRWLQGDECYVTDSGNCFHIKITVAAFPKTRDRAKEVVKNLFG